MTDDEMNAIIDGAAKVAFPEVSRMTYREASEHAARIVAKAFQKGRELNLTEEGVLKSYVIGSLQEALVLALAGLPVKVEA